MSQDAMWATLVVLGIVFLYILIKYIALRMRVNRAAEERFERWRDGEKYREVDKLAGKQMLAWRQEHEKGIREDAIKRSEAVIKGKATEHLVPFLPDFDFDPSDARFLGSPIDLIVFDGLSEGDLRRIVFVEIKTGQKPVLSPREKLVEEAVKEGPIEHVIMHVRSDS